MSSPDSALNRWAMLVRDLRKLRHWSLAELGAELGTDEGSVSRWEQGLAEPGSEIQKRIEALAQEHGLQSIFGLVMVVQASPFPMILVDRSAMVVAASASSGFVSGKTCLEQAPADERRYLAAFATELKKDDFWSAEAGKKLDYAFFRGQEIAGAVLVPVVIRGEVYVVVQKRDPVRQG